MKDFILFEKHEKTSELKNKFSKSVSYETLVGGTATICTDIKQTQRLSEGSADKPLIAIGTLTSLLCNSAKVMENLLQTSLDLRSDNESEKSGKVQRCAGYRFCKTMRFLCKNLVDYLLQISPVFRLMQVLGLVVSLSIGVVSESAAECVGATETTAGTDTITGAHCGICGTNCNWKIDGDTLKVTGGAKGEIGHMNAGAEWINDVYTYLMPWKGLKSEFSKVDISGVENVGHAAFMDFTNITDIKLDDSITKIESYAFAGSQVKTIILPDSLKTLEYRTFSDGYNNTLEEVVLPDTLSPLAADSHFGDNLEQLSNLKIICLGDTQKCKNVLSKYVYWDGSKPEGERLIPFSLAENVIPADYKYCNTTNYFWDGSTCIREPDVTKRKCCSSCKDVEGYCNRIRYTPAEAAKVLRDDNTNEITITFKK